MFVSEIDTEVSPLEIKLSPGLADFLRIRGISLALSTYDVGKIVFVGTGQSGKVWLHNRNFGRCLGMAFDDDGFWLAGDTQLVRYENLLRTQIDSEVSGQALFALRFAYFTGELDAHDVALDGDGQPLFVNTRFNCLARPSMRYSFEPIWKPDFISGYVPEDRCHLNGLAMEHGQPAYVSAVSFANASNGWRECRRDGGVVIDVSTQEIVCDRLSMPHSPRVHQNKLWVLNAGCGQFGYIDQGAGEFVAYTQCPGFLRGLDFIGGMAVVGSSLPRHNENFSGLQLETTLKQRNQSPVCGVFFIDLASGEVMHSLTIEGVIAEIYDVKVIPGVHQPSAIGPESAGVRRTLSLPEL